ncbi:efflux transporter periplasmic adaptor subunit [Cephaloticoccus primus]|uniref:Efflux transporter periplasmic adaptor subunit n=1 Tax=Cephaloticoccus primus TaxID=1548207 RepID=A0A139SII0_9BACT|nr:efflux RND transporter periplasmic adaptor subunit [Cephaloticoccus primus]KXU34357.1 efflux transporter periplasmic adaptor subunit [Cephaloticoccus primus]
MKNTASGLFGCAVALLALCLSACKPQSVDSGTASLPLVSVAPVVARNVHLWDEFNGRIEAVQQVALLPRVSGYIEQVHVREGQEVKAGEVLFTIDPRELQARLQRAEADLARARAQAQLSASEAARAQTLVEHHAISTELWEQRQSIATQAQAEVQAAQAALTQARLNLEWTQVRAPIDGRAGRARFTVGNLVTAGDAGSVLTTLVSQDTVYLYVEADERLWRRTANTRTNGLPLRVQSAGETGDSHAAVVDFFDNQVSRQTGTISMRATLDNATRQFIPGQFARVQVRSSEPFEALLIDDKAVLTDQDRKYVFVVDDAGVATRRDVRLGERADGLRIVRQGLNAGEQVVVGGTQRIATGTRVQVQAAETTGTSSPQHITALH